MRLLRPRVRTVTVLMCLGLVASCGTDRESRTPPAVAVSPGSTSTTLSEDDPPVVIGGAPGADGHLPVRLNPKAWGDIDTRLVEDDPGDPYHELHSEGHDDFWFGVELHTTLGPGWTGELGLFATDCIGAGICVRFDPDGGAGSMAPLLAAPTGEIDIERLDDHGYVLVFRNLIFTRDDTITYRIDTVVIDTT